MIRIFRPRSIKGLILTAALAVTGVLFVGLYLLIAQVYDETVRRDARQVSHLIAGQTFDAMFQVMRKGWSREELESFIGAMRARFQETPYSLRIFRGPKVEALFGPIEQPPMDARVHDAFRYAKPLHEETDGTVRHLYPLRARQECLRCHENARVQDVLGVIEVRQDMKPVLAQARGRFMTAMALLMPVPLFVAGLVAVRITRRLDGAFEHLRNDVAEIKRVSDLGELNIGQMATGFTELDRILGEVDGLGRKLRTFAVDKELLEFEIRVLERFVITSEVVRDWRDYIGRLLVEINEVLEAYVLFSIFKVDDELFDLEVFWRNEPTPETASALEQAARGVVHHHPAFRSASTVTIQHNVADPSTTLPPLGEREMELQSKSLLVEAPRIGGIVGIGFQAGLGQDPTRLLVMESVLSTLLNVVGSVKAIYKYTKDLDYYATRDPLTHLYNQRVFWEMAEHELARSARTEGRLALLLMDLDNFKVINDTYGHAFGDRVLKAFADLARETFRQDDLVARYGSDEFVALLPESPGNQALTGAQRFLDAVRALEMETPDGSRLQLTASIGIGISPDHAHYPKDLFMIADTMRYSAKAQGKDCAVVAGEEDVAEVYRELGEKSFVVLNALTEQRVVPYFQPIVDASDARVRAYEVLSRIQMPDGSILPAAEFIEAAERMGVVHRLDQLTMEAAFDRMAALDPEVELFINLSPKALVLGEFTATAKRMVLTRGIDPGRVVFELTERETVRNLTLLQGFVDDLKMEGFKFAIDDFGSGFSSFHYLKRFAVDYLKIDGDFIVNLGEDRRDQAFVRSIAALARDLGIQTVAEFVEDGTILEQVRQAGLDLAQGYHVGPPRPEPGG